MYQQRPLATFSQVLIVKPAVITDRSLAASSISETADLLPRKRAQVASIVFPRRGVQQEVTNMVPVTTSELGRMLLSSIAAKTSELNASRLERTLAHTPVHKS
jgi:hypothetical protein